MTLSSHIENLIAGAHRSEGAQVETAKLFWSGRSQAVRLAKAFRFEGAEVRIRRSGDAVILETIPADWRWLDSLVGRLDGDVGAATEGED
jgi:antitoxin VapB